MSNKIFDGKGNVRLFWFRVYSSEKESEVLFTTDYDKGRNWAKEKRDDLKRIGKTNARYVWDYIWQPM